MPSTILGISSYPRMILEAIHSLAAPEDPI